MNIKMGVIVGATEAKIGKVLVSVGDNISKDQALLNYETKKGNYTLKSPLEGVIIKMHFDDGDIIKKEDIIFTIEEEKEVIVASGTNITSIKMGVIPGAKEAIVGKINITCGETVNNGDELFQFETKKGSRAYKSTLTGQVVKILIEEGQQIEKDTHVLDIIQSKVEDVKDSEITFDKQTNLETDLLIIGAGPGGYVAALYAAKHGKKVILIEKESLGGTCLNVGCIPTKALVKSSEVHHSALNAEEFGIIIDKSAIKPDMDKIIEHKNSVVKRLVGGIEGLMNNNNVQVISGSAMFISDKEVEVVSNNIKNIISAKDIIIATGSKISSVPIKGLDLPFVLNSTQALSHRTLPKSIAIIGGGVIGMEFAFLYNNLGVEVTVIEYMDRLLTMLDEDESAEIKRMAIDKGIKVYNNSKVLEVGCDVYNKAIVTFENREVKKMLVTDNVLVAIGRQPNLEGLNLEASGVIMDPKRRGIKVDSFMQTNKSNIYAIGDVTNIIQLAHVASHQGIIAVDNILGNKKEMKYNAVPNVIFTSPEIATVGMSEACCKNENIEFKTSRFYYSGNGKAITMEETEGYIKLIEEVKTKRLLGAAIIGVDASNLISIITVAIQNNLSAEHLRETIFPHPTTSEIVHEAAMGLGIGTLHQ
ncbi:dihydrolipoyl dehydrogenase [Candidatus Izimaplasma bacterium ZiA1]|uniref:dihydrolipoyl dehydrogenase n=1 Tax=Candidatus Izimoplasma sp. ZiA1 TaxID=2024899 RepID=UPI000BAA3DAF|nr:dihydrolipoyl dehydrogenase [Candidatus Izimaplasma bacterium ZiA1]